MGVEREFSLINLPRWSQGAEICHGLSDLIRNRYSKTTKIAELALRADVRKKSAS